MAKRMILMLAVTATLIGALGFAKFRQIQEGMAQAAAFQPPPEAVTTIVAKQSKWPDTLNAIGTIAAVQGVTVSADLPGIVERIDFESGASVLAGDILVQLDTKQEQAQLAAVESDRDLARLNFERLKDLVEEGAISRAEYDRAAAEQRQTEAKVGEVRATIARKTIRAPFSGILGIRQVNLGQYLSAGNAVVPLQSLDPIYVNFSVPQQDAERTSRWPQRPNHHCRCHKPRVCRTGDGDQLDSRRGNAERSGSGHSCQPAKQTATRYVCSDRG